MATSTGLIGVQQMGLTGLPYSYKKEVLHLHTALHPSDSSYSTRRHATSSSQLSMH